MCLDGVGPHILASGEAVHKQQREFVVGASGALSVTVHQLANGDVLCLAASPVQVKPKHKAVLTLILYVIL